MTPIDDGDAEHGGKAGDQHQPAHLGDDLLLLGVEAACRRRDRDCSWPSMQPHRANRWSSPPARPGERLDRVLAARHRAVALAPQGADPRRRGRDRAPHDPRSGLSRQRRRRDRGRRAAARAGRARRPRTSRSTSCYEDDDIIVIDKPAGLVVHPAAGHATGTLVNALIAHCGDSLSGIGGVKRPGIVHRLDKDTTGLMVVAKNDRAHQRAGRPVRRPWPHRPAASAAIWRWSGARRTGPKGTIERADRPPSARAATRWRCAPGGREAITHWQVLERYQGIDGKPVGEPDRLPAGNRPHPPDPRASRPSRPSRCWATRLRPGVQDQGGPAAAGGPGGPGGSWTAGPACLSVDHRTPGRGKLEFRSELPALTRRSIVSVDSRR